jgi:hypothetical protein
LELVGYCAVSAVYYSEKNVEFGRRICFFLRVKIIGRIYSRVMANYHPYH